MSRIVEGVGAFNEHDDPAIVLGNPIKVRGQFLVVTGKSGIPKEGSGGQQPRQRRDLIEPSSRNQQTYL
jgi:hypothetical protein